jgi:hypothetical protein
VKNHCAFNCRNLLILMEAHLHDLHSPTSLTRDRGKSGAADDDLFHKTFSRAVVKWEVHPLAVLNHILEMCLRKPQSQRLSRRR